MHTRTHDEKKVAPESHLTRAEELVFAANELHTPKHGVRGIASAVHDVVLDHHGLQRWCRVASSSSNEDCFEATRGHVFAHITCCTAPTSDNGQWCGV